MGAEDHVDPGRPLHDGVAVLLRQAAADGDLHAGPRGLHRGELAEVAVEPVVGVLPHRAGVEDDDVGAVRALRAPARSRRPPADRRAARSRGRSSGTRRCAPHMSSRSSQCTRVRAGPPFRHAGGAGRIAGHGSSAEFCAPRRPSHLTAPRHTGAGRRRRGGRSAAVVAGADRQELRPPRLGHRGDRRRRPGCTTPTDACSRRSCNGTCPAMDVKLLPSQGSVREHLATWPPAARTSPSPRRTPSRTTRARTGRSCGRCARLYDDYMQLVVPAGSKVASAPRPARTAGRSGPARLRREPDRPPPADRRRPRPGPGPDRGARRDRHRHPGCWRRANWTPSSGRADCRPARCRTSPSTSRIKLVQLGDLVGPLHRPGRRRPATTGPRSCPPTPTRGRRTSARCRPSRCPTC